MWSCWIYAKFPQNLVPAPVWGNFVFSERIHILIPFLFWHKHNNVSQSYDPWFSALEDFNRILWKHICCAQIKKVTINGKCTHCQTYDMQTNIQYWWTCTILRILEWHTFVIGVFLSALDIFMPWTRYCLQKWGSWTTMVFRWDKKEQE